MHPSSPTQIPTSPHPNPHQHSFFSPPSTSNIQRLSNQACIRPGHARHSHPPLPHLLARVAFHDRLLHVHSIPTWKPSTGSASEPSPQYTNEAKRRNKMQPKNQRNSRMPISTGSATVQNPIRRRGTNYGPWRAWLQSREKETEMQKGDVTKKKTASRISVARQVILDRHDGYPADHEKK